MDQPVEECPRRQHYRGCFEADAQLRHHPSDTVASKNQIIRRLLEQRQIRMVFQAIADCLFVELTVSLSPGRTHRRAL